MIINKKIFFIITKIKLSLVRIISGFIINKQKRVNFRTKLHVKIKKNYLKQYLYVLNKNYKVTNLTNDTKIHNNKIWICWLQGEENAPEIVKTCIKSVEKFKSKNMDIIILTNENIANYVTIPNYIYQKKEKDYITNIQFSDILRVSILSKHGGMWLDATVLLTKPIPENILNSDFFAFHSKEREKHNNSWFLVSKSNNIFMILMKNLMFEYWKNENKMLDYFLYHLFFDLLIENNIELQKKWAKVPLYWDYDCYNLGGKMFEKYDEKEFKNLQKHFMHKLTYKYNKNANLKETYLEKILEI